MEAKRRVSDFGTAGGHNEESTATTTLRLCKKSAKGLLIVHAVVPVLVNRLNLSVNGLTVVRTMDSRNPSEAFGIPSHGTTIGAIPPLLLNNHAYHSSAYFKIVMHIVCIFHYMLSRLILYTVL